VTRRHRYAWRSVGTAALTAIAIIMLESPASVRAGVRPLLPPDPPAAERTALGRATPRPFSVGERTTYNVKFGIIHVGSGYMEVAGIDTVRGRDAWHTVFKTEGGAFFLHVNDVLESWFDTTTLSSLRFVQHIREGSYVRDRDYEIYPDRAVYVYNNKPEQPSVSEPLDDGSFLYFIRTLPLVVGETYTFDRYFNPKSNPVIIHVLRRERITVPAGTFNAIVVQPIIKTTGIFSDKGEAQVWFSDDSTRVMLQMKSKLSFGSIDLYLREYRPGRGPQASGSTPAPTTSPTDSGRPDAPPTSAPSSPSATPVPPANPSASPPAEASSN
jgi:hypothetical protein